MPYMALSSLQGLSGIEAIAKPEDVTFATPEERMGGTANPYHSQVGEQAKPYSWQSLQTPGASHGPYGPENQMLDDAFWFLEPAGYPEQDPDFDYNTPSLTRSHGSVSNVTNSGPLPSQFDAISRQIAQMGNKGSDLNTSNSMINNSLGYAKQDDWNEIWFVDDGNSDLPPVGRQFSHQANGFGVNDAASNTSRKVNLNGDGDKHMHRRYAFSSIPGNYLWMRPQGRPLFKMTAGTARLPIGANSQFAGQDPGATFAYDTGAILQDTPTEYTPPPSPNVQQTVPTYDNPMGTSGFDLW
jgi:hypothetical protein